MHIFGFPDIHLIKSARVCVEYNFYNFKYFPKPFKIRFGKLICKTNLKRFWKIFKNAKLYSTQIRFHIMLDLGVTKPDSDLHPYSFGISTSSS